MSEQIKAYVQRIFAPYKGIESANELQKEFEQSLIEKHNYYKQQGYTDEEAYQRTINSVGDVSELIDSIDPYHNEQKEKIYGPFSNGIMAGAVYVIFFIALMLVFDGLITRDTIVMPAVSLFALVSLVQYIVKGNSRYPRWLVIGSFIISIITSIIMTIIFH